MSIKSSRLIELLQYYRKFENFFRDAYDIYFYIYGYHQALENNYLSQENREDWVYNFLVFIRERLEEIYSPNEFRLWYNHFGEMIYQVEVDREKGVKLFYKLLDEFVESFEDNQSTER